MPSDDSGTMMPPDSGSMMPPQDSGVQSAWLQTSGNHINLGNKPWHGRGANLHDPRSCSACSGSPNAAEVNRRMDELSSWGANFIRLVLESSSLSQTVTQDANYLADIKSIVAHAVSKNIYTMVSLWIDPTFTSMGWPSNPATVNEWKTLATTFAKEPKVLFGLVNEPENNYDHSLDARRVASSAQVPHGRLQQSDAEPPRVLRYSPVKVRRQLPIRAEEQTVAVSAGAFRAQSRRRPSLPSDHRRSSPTTLRTAGGGAAAAQY